MMQFPIFIRLLGVCVAVALVSVLSACLLLVGKPAWAEPTAASSQAEVDRIKAEVAAINLTAEQAVERYNQANVELETTKQRIQENEKALSEAAASLAEAQTRLNNRVEEIYRSGSLSIMDVILNTSTFSEFLSHFDMLGKISDQDKADVDEVLRYKAEVEAAQSELDQTRQQQEEVLATLASEKSLVETQLAARQSVLASAQGEVAQMLAQQQQGGGAPGGGGDATGPVLNPETGPAADPEPAPAPDYGSSPPPASSGGAVSIAMQYLGVPYVWGGASPSGFDCSGLVMYVYAQIGVYLPHSAAAQYSAGTPISYSELAPGDLVFFGSPISHVGIYIGGGSMIHAPFEGTVVSISSVGGGGSYAGASRL